MFAVGEKTTVLWKHRLIYKHFSIVPTDAHYYKIVEMLKHFEFVTLAPTCFGSRRNHHQGAVLCLAKTTNMVYNYYSN
jgi:hypothetical protein